MARIITQVSLFILAAALLAACAATPVSPTTQAAGTTQVAAAAPAATATTTDPSGNSPTATAPAGTAAATSASSVTGKSGDRTFQIVPDQSEASYEVTEKFLNRALPNQAIGKTNAIQGSVVINTTGAPTASIPKLTVDLSTLTSDESRRDNMIRRNWLSSSHYPTATFVSTGIQGAPTSYTDGQEVSFKLTGNLTIHDTTKPVTFDVKAKLSGSTLTGTATTQLFMKDFGFDAPSIAGMLTVTDGVKVTLNFTANEAK